MLQRALKKTLSTVIEAINSNKTHTQRARHRIHAARFSQISSQGWFFFFFLTHNDWCFLHTSFFSSVVAYLHLCALVVFLCVCLTHPRQTVDPRHPPSPPSTSPQFTLTLALSHSRSLSELVQSQRRRVISGDAGQRDGAVTKHRAPPPGGRRGWSQSHGQPLQHQLAWRPRPEPDRVEAEEGAEQD